LSVREKANADAKYNVKGRHRARDRHRKIRPLLRQNLRKGHRAKIINGDMRRFPISDIDQPCKAIDDRQCRFVAVRRLGCIAISCGSILEGRLRSTFLEAHERSRMAFAYHNMKGVASYKSIVLNSEDS
jgi:hypothetical protein